MKGTRPWLVRWACRAGVRYFCPALAALVGPPNTKYFFFTVHFFNSFVPIAQQAGQAVVLGRLSLNMCLSVNFNSIITIIIRLFQIYDVTKVRYLKIFFQTTFYMYDKGSFNRLILKGPALTF
jgi:hypothetical protein